MSEPREFVCLGDALATEACRRIVFTAVCLKARGWGLCLQREDLEDIAQDVLLALWKRASMLCPDAPHRYVRRAAGNAMVDSLRRRFAAKRDAVKTVAFEEGAPAASPATSPEHRLLQAERVNEGLVALARTLSLHEVRAIWLVYGLGLSSKEASAALGVSVTGLDTTVHRGRRRLAAAAGIALPPRRAGSTVSRPGRSNE